MDLIKELSHGQFMRDTAFNNDYHYMDMTDRFKTLVELHTQGIHPEMYLPTNPDINESLFVKMAEVNGFKVSSKKATWKVLSDLFLFFGPTGLFHPITLFQLPNSTRHCFVGMVEHCGSKLRTELVVYSIQ